MKNFTLCSFIAMVVLMFFSLQIQGKKKEKQPEYKERETILKDVYLFGVAQNVTDSVTYFTNITPIRNAVMDKETGFMDGISLYTEQLEKHLQEGGHVGYICATFYYKSMKKAEKALVKLSKKTDKHSFTHVEPMGDFVYQYASPDVIYRNVIQHNEDEEMDAEEDHPAPSDAPASKPDKKKSPKASKKDKNNKK